MKPDGQNGNGKRKEIAMRYERTLKIDNIEFYNNLMSQDKVDYNIYGICPYSTVDSWTIEFEDGYEVDLKVCSSGLNDDIWCEAVLFRNGCELSHTDVYDRLDGTWDELEYDGIEFIFIVT